MLLRTPKYYKEFHCIADKCKDCCCGGWEIDIDNKTLDKYNKITGEFGDKLRKNIRIVENASFILDKHGKCPFLNKQHLCEVFIKLGEHSLCQICADHPRYYEWFSGIKEAGIGLCCEESARIILSQNEKFETVETEIPHESFYKYDQKLYSFLFNIRNKIISYLDDSSIELNKRIRNILWYADGIQLNIDNEILEDIDIFEIDVDKKSNLNPILNLYLTLDPLDHNWITYLKNSISTFNTSLDKLEIFEKTHPIINNYLKNISIYFIWRYFLKGVFDKDIISKVKFMSISIAVLKMLFFCKWVETGSISIEDCIEISKNYSKEIEYSEENLITLENAYYDIDDFSTENLICLF